LALLAHVARGADVVVALRDARMFTLGWAIVCASLIVPPIVSGATPTLEAVIWRFSRTSRGS
jgi:hypothetical protein